MVLPVGDLDSPCSVGIAQAFLQRELLVGFWAPHRVDDNLPQPRRSSPTRCVNSRAPQPPGLPTVGDSRAGRKRSCLEGSTIWDKIPGPFCPSFVPSGLSIVPRQEKRPPAKPMTLDIWSRGQDLNLRPSGYEPDELPDCSTPQCGALRCASSNYTHCPYLRQQCEDNSTIDLRGDV